MLAPWTLPVPFVMARAWGSEYESQRRPHWSHCTTKEARPDPRRNRDPHRCPGPLSGSRLSLPAAPSPKLAEPQYLRYLKEGGDVSSSICFNSFLNPKHARQGNSHRPHQGPGPGHPACAQPCTLRCRTSRFEGCGAEKALTQLAPTRTPAPAPPPALQPETHLGRERRGTCPQRLGRSRWPSLGARAAGTHTGLHRRQESGPAGEKARAGRRALGRLPARTPPPRCPARCSPQLCARPRAGPSPARRPGQWLSAELAALPYCFEPRSPKLERLGGSGEGRGPGEGPRGGGA